MSWWNRLCNMLAPGGKVCWNRRHGLLTHASRRLQPLTCIAGAGDFLLEPGGRDATNSDTMQPAGDVFALTDYLIFWNRGLSLLELANVLCCGHHIMWPAAPALRSAARNLLSSCFEDAGTDDCASCAWVISDGDTGKFCWSHRLFLLEPTMCFSIASVHLSFCVLNFLLDMVVQGRR